MPKQFHKFGAIALLLALCICLPHRFFAADYTDAISTPVSKNTDTGYEVYIDDWADLLSSSEEKALAEAMYSISAYGHVAFVSTDYNPTYSVESYAKEYGLSHFGYDSYTIFVIDMDYRKICVYSDGEIYQTITSSYAYTITDNVYPYASKAEYYNCAFHAFEQIQTLLEGRAIAQPMKYISNALLAVVLALLFNYFLVMLLSRSKKANDRQILNNIHAQVAIHNPTADFLHQTKRYSPQSSGSSGARSGGGSIGGGGGGGSRGGGGGGSHSF